MNLDEHLNETKKKQADLRVIQQKRDRGYTFGHDYKHPCKKEKEASLQCVEMQHHDKSIDCKPYFDNYQSCNKFWTEVQMYRARYMKKTRYDLPQGEEYDLWKQQLPEWLSTKRLNIPDIPKESTETEQ